MKIISKAKGSYVAPFVDYNGNLVHGHYEMNLSSEYTALIREAGKACERYASDVLIGIDNVEYWLKSAEKFEGKSCTRFEWFGFRDSGVDHETFVRCRLKNAKAAEIYDKVYILMVAFADGDCEATLFDATEDIDGMCAEREAK